MKSEERAESNPGEYVNILKFKNSLNSCRGAGW
jgi:hypothetical protein